MLLTSLALSTSLASVAVCTSNSDVFSRPNSTGVVNASLLNHNHDSTLLTTLPIPSPNQTLGSYADEILRSIFGPRKLAKRHLIHTPTILTSTWAVDQGYFNISLDRCVEFSTVTGVYTSNNGTRYNATLLDINNDLRYRLGSPAAIEQAIALRVLENAQRAIAEAEAYLQTAICNYDIRPIAHDELRRLLAPDGFWVALMTKSAIFGGVSAGIYTGILNRNASTGQAIGVSMSAAGLTIMDGIIGRLQGNGRLSFLEATITSAFTAWYRRAVMIAADSQESMCIPQIVVHDSIGSLPVSSDPSLYFDAWSEIEIEQLCRG